MAHPTKAIKELCSFSNGHGFTRHDWAKNGLPIIRIAHLNGSRDFDYYAGEPDPEWVVEPGELLFAWAGTKGVSFGPTIWDGPRGVLNQHIFRVRPKDGVDQTWLYYALLQVTQRIESRAHGFKSTLLHVRKSDIEDQRSLVPPVATQRRVVELLGLVEGQLRGTSELIQTKRNFKRGLMQQLLTGQKRFPKFRDRPWVKHRIGDLFEEIERPVEWNDADDYRLVSIRRRSGGMFLRDVKKGAEIKTKQMYVVRTGDIVISRMQVVHGAVAMVPPEFDGCNVSGTYLVLVPRSGAPIDPGFFEYLTQTPRMYHAAYTSSYGVHIEKMTFNPEWYLETPVLLPPTVAEQERIARVLDLCCSEVDLLAAQREQIEVMRRALLSRLLSGSLSVPV